MVVKKSQLWSLIQVFIAAAAICSGNVHATSLWKDPRTNSCTSSRCGSEILRGTWVDRRGDAINTQPYVTQIYAKQGECVLVEVVGTQRDADAAMTLISPAGFGAFGVWTDDDAGVGSRPRIALENAPRDGWYTLHVARWLPSNPGSETWFLVRYGRYNGGNPNCASPTAPMQLGPAAFGASQQKKPID